MTTTNIIRYLGSGLRRLLFGWNEMKRLEQAKRGDIRSSAFERFVRVANESRHSDPYRGVSYRFDKHSNPTGRLAERIEQQREDSLMAPLLGTLQLPPDTAGDGTQVSVDDSQDIQESTWETEGGAGRRYFGADIDMNIVQAEIVRIWRTEHHKTWREIAALWSERYWPKHGSNQLFGMDVCDKAATMLGQNMYDDVWNGGLDEDA